MIPTFGNTASVSEVVAALRSSGAAIVTSAASSELMQIVAAELRSGFDECALEEQSAFDGGRTCLLYTSPSPRDATLSRMPSSA